MHATDFSQNPQAIVYHVCISSGGPPTRIKFLSKQMLILFLSCPEQSKGVCMTCERSEAGTGSGPGSQTGGRHPQWRPEQDAAGPRSEVAKVTKTQLCPMPRTAPASAAVHAAAAGFLHAQ